VQDRLATEAADRLDLDGRGGLRHHDQRGMPSRLEASATPWAWLPAEAAITPRARSAADSWTMRL